MKAKKTLIAVCAVACNVVNHKTFCLFCQSFLPNLIACLSIFYKRANSRVKNVENARLSVAILREMRYNNKWCIFLQFQRNSL